MSLRRVVTVTALCVSVAAVAPAAHSAGRVAHDRAWRTTAIPAATLEIGKRGWRANALSSDGRTAVVVDAQGVYLFHASSERRWASRSAPTAALRVSRAALVFPAVAISADGTTVVVAADDVQGNHVAVYVFHVSSPRAWRGRPRPTATLTNAAEPGPLFGSSVAISSDGTTVLVAQPLGADVFHVASADSWTDTSTPTATLEPDAAGAEEFGLTLHVALSADGTIALIGSVRDGNFVGGAHIFRTATADTWVSSTTPDAVLVHYTGQADDFGYAVALSPDATTALVGAPNFGFNTAGAAYFYGAGTPDGWTFYMDPDAVVQRSLVRGPGGGTSADVLGSSVALSEHGRTALVGEPSMFGGQGAVDVLHVAGVPRSVRPWRFDKIFRAKLTNAASPPRDGFGDAVALSSDGTTVLVSSNRGTFVFTRASSRGGAGYCYVPYVDEKRLSVARRAIASTHCRVGTVTRVGGTRVGSGRVISQTPRPGNRLPKGTTIDLRVSKGRAR